MGKGGPLAFLNKKPWHPSRPQNLEEVWKREQNAAAEQKKLEELKLQYEEERKNEEFMDMARKAGHGPAADRLDWMYAGSMAAKEDAEKRQEQALLGQKAAQLAPAAPTDTSMCETASNLTSVNAVAPPASQNEQWQRLNNDPLLMIKRQQQEALKKVRDNPIKMQEVLKQVREQAAAAEAHKEKKHKKDKKHKKEKKHKRGRDSDSGNSSDEGGPAPRPAAHAPPPPPSSHHDRDRQGYGGRDDRGGRQAPGRSRSRSPPSHAPSHGGRYDREAPAHASHGGRYDRDGGGDRGRDRQPPADQGRDRERERERDRHPQERGQQDRHGDRNGQHGRDEDRRPGRDGRDDRERDGRDGGRGERDGGRGERDGGRGEREGGRGERDGGRGERDGGRGKRDGGRGERDGRDKDGGREWDGGRAEAAPRPSAAAAGDAVERRPGYGLIHSTAAPDASLRGASYDPSKRGEETRERLKEAAKKKEEEEKAKAMQRGQRQAHKTGQMTEEERARRLAEMSSNAEQHDQARLDRLHKAANMEAAQDTGSGVVANAGGVAGTARKGDAFAAAASRDVYGALAGASLEARVNSRKHYAQR